MKYKLTETTLQVGDVTVYQIQCTSKSFIIQEGTLGGYVENYDNLDFTGTSWIYPGAICMGSGKVLEQAVIRDSAIVSGNAIVKGSSSITNNAKIQDYAVVADNSRIFENAIIRGDTEIIGHCSIGGGSIISTGIIPDNTKLLVGDEEISIVPVIINDFHDKWSIVFGDKYLTIGCVQKPIPYWESLNTEQGAELGISEYEAWWWENKETILGFRNT